MVGITRSKVIFIGPDLLLVLNKLGLRKKKHTQQRPTLLNFRSHYFIVEKNTKFGTRTLIGVLPSGYLT